MTLGGPCVTHDVVERPAFLRGRPYVSVVTSVASAEPMLLAFAD